MKRPLKVGLLGLLLFALTTINCKAEEFDTDSEEAVEATDTNKDSWDENECIEGDWEDNAYYKLLISQWYQKNNKWHEKPLYYSKYAYAFDNNEEDDGFITISFLNKDDYNKTKTAWQKELPNYVLKRIFFYDKYLTIEFLTLTNKDVCEERKNTHKIDFAEAGNIGLERYIQQFPNAKELSR